jgi:hypothetical protein
MALHRKQRGFADAAPQYVRIPTPSGRAVGYSLHEAHPRAQRVYAKRFTTAGDRSRKISSLQLRACFLLCVLLYFAAIYFADDIASFGRVVGSEQNSQNFFVHSLRPRGRGNMRVGRAVDAKKTEATAVPVQVTVLPSEAEQQPQQQQKDNPPTQVPEIETQSPEAATAETEAAQATKPLDQPETEAQGKTMHQDEHPKDDGVLGDAVHPDDQGEHVPAERANPVDAHPDEKPEAATSSEPAESNDLRLDSRKRDQVQSNVALAAKKHVAKTQPEPTAAIRHPEKDHDANTVPAASPARVQQQHVRGHVASKHELPKRPTNLRQKPSEAVDGQQLERQRAGTPTQAKGDVTEHISDI